MLQLMLALLRAPVKIRFGISSRWGGVAVLLIVETLSHCALAQQTKPETVENGVIAEAETEVSSNAQQEKTEAEVEAERLQAEEEEAARKEAQAIQECQRLVVVAIGKVKPPEIFPDVLAKSNPENSSLKISLGNRSLVVEVDGARALSCPIACGRVGNETESGQFKVVSKSNRAPRDCDYGSLIDAQGKLLLKGVYSNLDPVPEGAAFVASPPNAYIVLTEDVVIHSGDANGTASTNGAIVIPTTAARTLLKILEKGMPVTIE